MNALTEPDRNLGFWVCAVISLGVHVGGVALAMSIGNVGPHSSADAVRRDSAVSQAKAAPEIRGNEAAWSFFKKIWPSSSLEKTSSQGRKPLLPAHEEDKAKDPLSPPDTTPPAESEEVEKPQPTKEEPKIKLGSDNGTAEETIAWISYDDFRKLVGRPGSTPQPALQTKTDPSPIGSLTLDGTPAVTGGGRKEPLGMWLPGLPGPRGTATPDTLDDPLHNFAARPGPPGAGADDLLILQPGTKARPPKPGFQPAPKTPAAQDDKVDRTPPKVASVDPVPKPPLARDTRVNQSQLPPRPDQPLKPEKAVKAGDAADPTKAAKASAAQPEIGSDGGTEGGPPLMAPTAHGQTGGAPVPTVSPTLGEGSNHAQTQPAAPAVPASPALAMVVPAGGDPHSNVSVSTLPPTPHAANKPAEPPAPGGGGGSQAGGGGGGGGAGHAAGLPAGPTPNPTIAPRSDKESVPVTLTTERLDIHPGGVITGQGIEIKTVIARYSAVALASAVPHNVEATLVFNKDGEVINVDITRSSGYADIDGPLRASLYEWRASGKKVQEINHSFQIPFTIVLSRDE